MVKNPPAMQEIRVQSLSWEDALEKGMATHSSILAWRIPWREEPGGLQSIRWWRAGHAWVTHTHTHTHTYSFTLIPCSSDGKRIFLQCRRPRFDPWVGKILSRSKWQPTTLAWRIHGQRSLAGYSPWGCKELDMTEQLTILVLMVLLL